MQVPFCFFHAFYWKLRIIVVSYSYKTITGRYIYLPGKQKGVNIMTKTIKELTQDLLQAPSACKEIKTAAQNYLDASGTPEESRAAEAYVKELEADITPIDGLISFAGSQMGAQVFGTDGAKKILDHAEKIKAAGAKYCDCPACAACEALLQKKGEILK